MTLNFSKIQLRPNLIVGSPRRVYLVSGDFPQILSSKPNPNPLKESIWGSYQIPIGATKHENGTLEPLSSSSSLNSLIQLPFFHFQPSPIFPSNLHLPSFIQEQFYEHFCSTIHENGYFCSKKFYMLIFTLSWQLREHFCILAL